VTVYPADLSDSADGLGGGCMDPRVVDITLEPGVARGPEEGFGIVNFSREARSYPPNSVGRMNGLQYDSIAITPEMGIGDVLAIAGRPELAPLAAPGLSR